MKGAPWLPGLFTGLIHIFLDGTFAVFNHLVSFENDQGRLQRPWFVEAWHLWGGVDKRYRKSDSFIVVQVAAMALVAGPACLIFAWATFERDGLAPRARSLGHDGADVDARVVLRHRSPRGF